MKELTKKQIRLLTSGSKHWSERKHFLVPLAKSFGVAIESDEQLQYLIEVHCPQELKRIEMQYQENIRSGRITNNYTPTDVKGTFDKVETPRIGGRYHVSWAYSGAVFELVSIEGDTCYLDNPRHRRKKLITCRVSDLRELRSK